MLKELKKIKIKDPRYTMQREYMRCPECNSARQKVTHTGAGECGTIMGIARRRVCLNCNHAWKTMEIKL